MNPACILLILQVVALAGGKKEKHKMREVQQKNLKKKKNK